MVKNEKEVRRGYRRATEFFDDAESTDIAVGLKTEMERERRQSPIDTDRIREQEDWTFLANRVVGGEGR